jgi:hypothetical protein
VGDGDQRQIIEIAMTRMAAHAHMSGV